MSVLAFRDRRYVIVHGNHASAADFDATSWTSLNGYQLPEETVVKFNKNVNVREPFRANTYRVPVLEDLSHDTYGVAPTATITMPFAYGAANDFMGYLLGAAYQTVSVSGAGPYVHTYTYPTQASTSPNFNGNGGAFFTLIEDTGHSSSGDRAILSCRPTRATLSYRPESNDARLYWTIDVFGRYAQDGATYSGTPVLPTWTYISASSFKDFTIGGTTVPCFGFDYTLTPNIKPIPVPGYSAAAGHNETDAVMPYCTAALTCDVQWDDTVKALISGEGTLAEKAVVIQFAAGTTASSNGELVLKMNAAFKDHTPQGTEEQRAVLQAYALKGGVSIVSASYATARSYAAAYSGGFWG